ncbi:MAG: hypothetical protein EA362_07150 [Saprospirales bacterium]|nr:MAG: hypothetical protein EA362_07150 [Saprospirales bacterium]
MIDDLILAPTKDGSGVVWMAHGSAAITNFGHRPPYGEGKPFKMPIGLTEFWGEEDAIHQFNDMHIGAFRVMEEAYNQIYNWHLEYGDVHVVSGLLSCTDSVANYPPGEMVFVALMDVNAANPYSVCFLWPNRMDQRPLTEMVFSLSELNAISVLNIFQDLIRRQEIESPSELTSILSLGYNTDHFQNRLNVQSLEGGD